MGQNFVLPLHDSYCGTDRQSSKLVREHTRKLKLTQRQGWAFGHRIQLRISSEWFCPYYWISHERIVTSDKVITLPHFVLRNQIISRPNGNGKTGAIRTANIPPCQGPCSCFCIQDRLSRWKGRRVNFIFSGWGAIIG